MKDRENWIDYIKVLACILVALGHFLMSMRASCIVDNSKFYDWFISTIYTFHVPLFFICSGYLYQKYSVVNSFGTWKRNLKKKFVSLSVPYVVFSLLTWGMKIVASSFVNSQIGGLFETIFTNPTAPYWYLYCLFFIFVITPTLTGNRSILVAGLTAIIMKCVVIIGGQELISIYAAFSVFTNEIWFIAGMVLCQKKDKFIKLFSLKFGLFIGIVCLIVSTLVDQIQWNNLWVCFILGSGFCVSIVSVAMNCKYRENARITYLSKYTMPVFLMHTMFAAPIRIILLKVGVQNFAIHTVAGISMSFIAPVITMTVMNKIKWLEFIVFPNKFIKI